MNRVFYVLMTFAVALFFTACGDSGAGNAGNKPANAASNANSSAAAPADPKAAEADIKKVMDNIVAALSKNDADAMDKIYADNYQIVNVDGSVQNKAERLAALRSGEVKYTSFAYSEPNVRVSPDGNSAVVIGKLSMKGTFKGKTMDGDYRNTLVFTKAKDGWKLASASSNKIEGGDKAKADDKTKAGEPQKKISDAVTAVEGDNPPPPPKKK